MMKQLALLGILISGLLGLASISQQPPALTKARADLVYVQRDQQARTLVPFAKVPFWASNGWTPSTGYTFNLYRQADGDWTTDFDAVSTLPADYSTDKTTWPECFVDPVAGADGNSGETSALPKRTLGACLSINSSIFTNAGTARSRVIRVKAGSEFRIGDSATRGTGWNGQALVAHTIVTTYGENGGVRGTARWTSSNEMPERTWSLDQGTTWTASVPSTAGFVFDRGRLDPTGNGRSYTSVASVALVRTTPYSFYSTSSVIHINTNSTTAPTALIDVVRSVSNGLSGDNDFDLWVFNGTFTYGLRAWYTNMAEGSSNTPRQVFSNCTFEKGTGTDSFRIEGPAEVFLDKCTIQYAESDGANYRFATKAFELNCISRWNGALSAAEFGDYKTSSSYNSNQGSTTHDDAEVLRVGGRYYGNGGQGTFDTGSGGTFTYAWSIGVHAYNQRGDKDASKRDADFGCGSETGDRCYLIDPKPVNPETGTKSSTYYWLSAEKGITYTDHDLTGDHRELLAGGATKVVL